MFEVIAVLFRAAIAAFIAFLSHTPYTRKSNTFSTTPATNPPTTTFCRLILPIEDLAEWVRSERTRRADSRERGWCRQAAMVTPSAARGSGHHQEGHEPPQLVGDRGHAMRHDPFPVHQQVEAVGPGGKEQRALPHVVAHGREWPRRPVVPVPRDRDGPRPGEPEPHHAAVPATLRHEGSEKWVGVHPGPPAHEPNPGT